MSRSNRHRLWPPPEGDENRKSTQPERRALSDKPRPQGEKNAAIAEPDAARHERKQNAEQDALLRNQINTVITKARSKWPGPKKRPTVRAMAKELCRLHKKELGLSFETIRKILDGTYSASQRLNISGL